MPGFGENLRREREMRGIALQEISESTKVSVRLLEALENEEFSKLPGGIFTRSFIRAYANYLGLDEERVMAEYRLAAPPKGEEDFSRIGVNSNTAKRKSRAPFLPWIVAFVLLAGGYAIFRYSHRSSELPLSFGNPPLNASGSSASGASANSNTAIGASSSAPQVLAPDSANTALPASAPASASPGASAVADPPQGASRAPSPDPAAAQTRPLQPLSASADVKPVAATSATESTAPSVMTEDSNTRESRDPAAQINGDPPSAATPETRGDMVLQVATTQRSWVAVDADGKTILERILNPNEVRTLSAKNYFDVTTGNALGTVLTLDGVTLKPMGRSGEVKTVRLTRNDLRNLSP